MIKGKKEITHPGVYIKDAIEELGIRQEEFANETGIPITLVSSLINGESDITPDIATVLANFFHNDAEGWIRLQLRYDSYFK